MESRFWKCIGLLALAGFAACEVQADGPTGVTVSPGDAGTVSVTAVAAPLQEVLTALAQADGCDAEFAAPLPARVTLTDASGYRTPEEWIYDINSAMNVSSKREEGMWRFEVMFPERYDPSLSAEEVVTRYRRAERPEAPREGIVGAVLILHGQYAPPPYEVRVVEEADGGRRIEVNGVAAETYAERPTASPPPMPAGDLKGFQAKNYLELERVAAHVWYPELRKTMGTRAAIEEVVRRLRGQDIVIEVEVTWYENIPSILMSTTDGVLAGALVHSVFPASYDFDTGVIFGDEPLPLEKRVEMQAETLRKQLARPEVVVYGRTGIVVLRGPEPALELAEILEQGRDRDVLELECALIPLLEDRQLAREVAANAARDAEALVPALVAFAAERDAEPGS